ncbi:putative exonuclease GOR [Nomia melanderi]|uniref:putative exonuclease GOR n=1 Tax=Nomia melanderi TaxID=2448451 RepID=UPI001304446B|nr:putative exonuclease GOR [Nomia melanderi]
MPNERICNRCGKRYAIDEQGFALRPEKCIYHWGKKYRSDDEYSCCRRRGLAVGCTYAVTHVWEYTDYENLRGYVKTLPKDTPAEEQGIYALDCEMSYTTRGLKVTSVTVVNENGCVVYQTLVRPESPILDYNTRYSGITEEDMRNVTTTLADVQKTMLTMFSEKTILVGHGLENDLRSLQLLHDTVIDTTVIFPHRQGYPNKRALKNICAEFLRKTIQNDASGHDSKEDAVSCMELIFWKAKCIVDAKPW